MPKYVLNLFVLNAKFLVFIFRKSNQDCYFILSKEALVFTSSVDRKGVSFVPEERGSVIWAASICWMQPRC